MAKTAVVVLAWNGWPTTRRCLLSLKDCEEEDLLIFLVDNGSEDGTPNSARAEFPDVVIIENGTNLGYAAGNNVGISAGLAAGCDRIMVLNNDTTVSNSFAPLLAALTANEAVGAVSPVIKKMDGSIWFSHAQRDARTGVMMQRQAAISGIRDTPALTGACVLARREVWNDVGGFDPGFFLIWEDMDWCERVRAAGWRLAVVADSIIQHEVGSSFARSRAAIGAYYHLRNGLIYLWRWSDSRYRHSLNFLLDWSIKPILKALLHDRSTAKWLLRADTAAVLAVVTGRRGKAPQWVR